MKSGGKSMTAWERWELASFEEERKRPHPLTAAPTVAAATAEKTPQTTTAEEIEQLRQQAYQTGHSEGFAAGKAQGLAAGQAEGAAMGKAAAAQLLHVAGKLDQALTDLDPQVADELSALAMAIAREVMRQSIAVKPEIVVGVVRDALAQLPHLHASIFLHPDDASLVRSYAGESLAHAGHRIHENGRLQRGDVVIESGGAHIDATLATRWKRVIETLGREAPWFEE
ncbi:MAG: flagellar assembly protein FliH [Rhodocyclaceae bacterium]|jgi:flagellar assembly protein FliH|nr:flagellar assembly protein FliH [Rhodocyclaceae bacterium]